LIRVLVWAKSAVTRAGLEAIVQSDPRFDVAGPAGRSPDLPSALRESTPDVLLIDLADTSIARLLPGFSDQPGPPGIVVLLDTMTRSGVLRLLQAGVRAVLAPESHPREITAALEAAHDGLAAFSPEILDLLLPTSAEPPGDLPPGEPLTERESHVLALLAEGAGNKEIAARLHISEHTVKFHVSSILGKLGAATRTEAVARGYREGLILM
jgi:NarL family two-component system response regulator YdfI